MADGDNIGNDPVQVAAGPWQADIEQAIQDPAMRATVDALFRSKVQPRMTQLEQQVAQAREAQEFLGAFQTDPDGTYRALTEHLWGDAGQAALAALDAQFNQQPEQPTPPPEQQAPPPAVSTDPRLDEVYRFVQSQREQQQREEELAAYDAAVEQIVSDPANADIRAGQDRYHHFVHMADGDFNRAIDLYREDAARAQMHAVESLGLTPEQLAALRAQAEAVGAAPPVIGSEASGTGVPIPTAPSYAGPQGLNQAIEDTMNEVFRRSAPPVMGSQ